MKLTLVIKVVKKNCFWSQSQGKKLHVSLTDSHHSIIPLMNAFADELNFCLLILIQHAVSLRLGKEQCFQQRTA